MKTIYSLFLVAIIGIFGATADALTVSPPILEISADPGSIVEGEIKIFNESDRSQTFYTSFENFEPSENTGVPRFVGAETGLATWISSTPSLTLTPQQELLVPYQISIPLDAEPGGYFAATFFGANAPESSGGTVSIGGRIGVLMLLRVNGDIPEAAGLFDYQTSSGNYLYTSTPIDFEYRFSNDGGDRVIPRGDIEIKDTFGRVRATIDANLTEGNVLPDSARLFSASWGKEGALLKGFFARAQYQWNNFHLGFYSADLSLAWGSSNQIASDSLSFFVFPWQLLLLILLISIFIFFVIKFGGRAYKKSLLRQLEKMQQAQKNTSQ